MINLQMLPAMPFTVALVAGVLAGYFISTLPFFLLFFATIIFTIIGLCLLNHRRLRSYPLLIAFMLVGCMAMYISKDRLDVVIPKEKVTVEGTVLDTPRLTDKHTLLTLYVHKGPFNGKKVRCYIPKEGYSKIKLGATYVFKGRWWKFENFSNNTNFDYVRWAKGRSLVAQGSIYEGNFYQIDNQIERLPFFERLSLKSKLLRQRVLKLFEQKNISPEHFAIVSAMAFGERSLLSQETRDMFARTGVSHLLALSGLHLGILYTLLSMLFVRLGWKTIGSSIVVTAVWLYVFLVGMQASVVRAATMLTIYSILSFDSRRKTSANPLFVTIAIMLLCNPLMIWDIGFQMSVFAVLSISCFYFPIYRLIGSRFLSNHVLLRALWAMIVISLSAQIGVLPLIIYYFGYVSVYFLLTNIIALPIVTILLYSVFLSLIFWWFPLLRELFIWCLRFFSTALEWCLQGIDSLKGVSIENVCITPLQLLILYIILIVLVVVTQSVSLVAHKSDLEHTQV